METIKELLALGLVAQEQFLKRDANVLPYFKINMGPLLGP